MSKKMLIDASHPEETRVVVVNGTRVEELDFESQNKRQLRGNVYLARVTRVEPSLQAAFVEFGGNRHGFLAFGEIHPDYYDLPHEDRMALIEAEEAENRADDAEDDDEDEDAPAVEMSESVADTDDDEDEGEDPLRPAANTFALANRRKEKALPAAVAKPKKVTQKAPAKSKSKKITAKPAPVEIEEDENTPDPTRKAATSWNVSQKLVFSNFDIEKDPTSPAADNFKHAEVLKVADYDPSIIPEDDDDEDDIDTEMLEDAADDDDKEVAEEQANMDRKRKKRISRRRYKIQEVVKRGQIMLVQAVKEERGNKGAALTTYLSLAGRYCVLMPNTPRGGGISRKIANGSDRKRLKSIMSELEVPKGMGVIVRTAGAKRTRDEIQHDYDYLARLWETIRSKTLKSFAPALIHQEGDLVKRSIRDMYNKDISEILVQGESAYEDAHNFIDMLMPSHIDKVKHYEDDIPLFLRYQAEQQIEASLDPVAQLKSGGYLVIHPTEALVSVDVNSGRSTKERNVERTALKTNLEAAEEVARQMRLRDLAGLVVIDFIDMDENRNNRAVEKKMKEALSRDRARVQMGRISQFGLMEISRQRRRRSLLEGSSASCEHCAGVGRKRTIESSALKAIRAVEEEGIRGKAKRVRLKVSPNVALYLFNEKRDLLQHVDAQFNMFTELVSDDTLHRPEFTIERVEEREGNHEDPLEAIKKAHKAEQNRRQNQKPKAKSHPDSKSDDGDEQSREGRNKRRRRRGGKRNNEESGSDNSQATEANEAPSVDENGEEQPRKRRRRRGRRGGRGKRGPNENTNADTANADNADSAQVKSDTTAKTDDGQPTDNANDKPKRNRNRRRKSSDNKGESEAPANAVEAEAPVKTEAKDAKDAPKRKRTRSKAPAPKTDTEAKPETKPEAKAKTADKPKRTRAKAPAPKKDTPKVEPKPAKAKADTKPAKTEKPKRVRAKAPAPKKSETPAAETPAPKATPKPKPAPVQEQAQPPEAKAEKPASKDKAKKGGWWSKRNPFK